MQHFSNRGGCRMEATQSFRNLWQDVFKVEDISRTCWPGLKLHTLFGEIGYNTMDNTCLSGSNDSSGIVNDTYNLHDSVESDLRVSLVNNGLVGPYSATVLVTLSSAPDHRPPRLDSARSIPSPSLTPGGCLDSALYRIFMWEFPTYI
ncbi:hypothetical protein TNCV_14671 [Trichonephila clavipes]|nr:hypothetical protein TNCV_14671 [Trichonephila clavipes]